MSQLGFQTSGVRVKHRNRTRSCLAVLIAAVVLLGGAGLVAIKGREWLESAFATPDYTGQGSGSVTIQVTNSQTATDIGYTLEEKDVVKSAEAFIKAAKREPRSRSIQPGYYQLRVQMSGEAALALLLDPNARERSEVTVPEGRRLTSAIQELATGTGLPKADFDAVLKQPDSLELPSYAKGRPEGFLFPARYPTDPGTTAEAVLFDMVKRYKEEAVRLDLEARAKELGYSPLQVVTIASLIEAEVRQPDDFPKVARVIYNRLSDKQHPWLRKLQFDSTVHYAVGKAGNVATTRADRANKSPYNTYVHAGLPPGPINSPGAKALEAALNPADGGWLYFVAVNPDTGETKFASSSAEHEKNVKEFQAWCRKHKDRC
ncbi:endolytic transglycosylase MltG [Flindersiella endophytica]